MSYYADETYDVYETTYPVARKEHRCDACERIVPPGEVYARVNVVFDGTAETIKRCGRCETLHLHLRELCSGEDMWPDERLACGRDYETEWYEKPPADIAALPLLSAAEASQLANEYRTKQKEAEAERRRNRQRVNAQSYALRVLGWLLYDLDMKSNPFDWWRWGRKRAG